MRRNEKNACKELRAALGTKYALTQWYLLVPVRRFNELGLGQTGDVYLVENQILN